jgi:hypothetical protein
MIFGLMMGMITVALAILPAAQMQTEVPPRGPGAKPVQMEHINVYGVELAKIARQGEGSKESCYIKRGQMPKTKTAPDRYVTGHLFSEENYKTKNNF